MYRLYVYYAGSQNPMEVVSVCAAAEVLTQIPTLLARHPGCGHVEVKAGLTRLFSVDCKGERLRD